MTWKVLLIEDQNPFIIAELLKAYNEFDFTTVKNGAAAIEAFAAQDPDIILLDLRLPGVHGFVVLEAIRRIDPDVPVVIVTAYEDRVTRERCRELGANAFFRKPPNYRKLYREMERLITTRVIAQASRHPVLSNVEGPDPATTLRLDERRSIILAKARRLQKLREKQALYGLNVPAELQIEIEDLENEIAELQADYEQTKKDI